MTRPTRPMICFYNSILDFLPENYNQFLVIFAIAFHHRTPAGAWCSVKTICETTGRSRMTVYRTIKRLEERGMVTVEHVGGKVHFYLPTNEKNIIGDPTSEEFGCNKAVIHAKCGKPSRDVSDLSEDVSDQDIGCNTALIHQCNTALIHPSEATIISNIEATKEATIENHFSNIEKEEKEPHPPAKEKKKTPGSGLGKKQRKELIAFSTTTLRVTGDFLNPQQLQALEDFILENDHAPGDVRTWLKTLEEE